MKTLAICALALTVLAGGCVRAQRFRYVQLQPECFSANKDPLPGVDGEQRPWPSLECLHTAYSIGFIEFDEQGSAIDPNQAEKTLALIEDVKRQAPGGKIITLVYVHGWKNNASEANSGGKAKDVEKFKSALTELGYRSRSAAAASGESAAPIPIVGVYMAWRGKSLKGPSWFTFISLWSRRNTANRIGDGEAFAPTLTRILERVNDGSGSRVMLVGHSFGARALEHAIETHKVDLYKKPTDDQPADPLVDLTLYVNSANDARLSLARIQSMRTSGVGIHHPDYDAAACRTPKPEDAERCRDYPLIVAVSSEGDFATRYLLPAADTFNLEKLDPRAPTPAKPDGGPYLDDPPSFWRLQRSAAAQVTFLQSHAVYEAACPPIPDPIALARQETEAERVKGEIRKEVLRQLGRLDELKELEAAEERQRNAAEAVLTRARKEREEAIYHPRCPAADKDCRFIFRTQDADPVCFQGDRRVPAFVEGQIREPYNQTAFWTMSVDSRVINDHGDIWNLSFVEMLSQLMAPRGFFDPGKGRVRVVPTLRREVD